VIITCTSKGVLTMQRKIVSSLLLILAFSLTIFSFGCDSQGPAEKAGEEVDKSIEATKDAVEGAGEEIEKAIEKAKSD